MECNLVSMCSVKFFGWTFLPFLNADAKKSHSFQHLQRSAHHFTGAQFMKRNCGERHPRFLRSLNGSCQFFHNFFGRHSNHQPADQFIAGNINCLMGVKRQNKHRFAPPKQCSPIGINNNAHSVLILPAHNKNCDTQCCNRSYRLNPARPIRCTESAIEPRCQKRGCASKHQQRIANDPSFQVVEINCHKAIIS